MNLDTAMMNSMATLQKAQTAQLASLASARYGTPVTVPTLPSLPMDTVTLGGYPADPGLMPDPRKLAQMMGQDWNSIPLSSDPDYLQRHQAIYDQLLEKIMAVKALEAAQGGSGAKGADGKGTSASKGDLNVVAGGEHDGVKFERLVANGKARLDHPSNRHLTDVHQVHIVPIKGLIVAVVDADALGADGMCGRAKDFSYRRIFDCCADFSADEFSHRIV